MAAPNPRIALIVYRSHVFGHKNEIINELSTKERKLVLQKIQNIYSHQ
jgi:hypothetical protein